MRLNRVVPTMIKGCGQRLLPAGLTAISYTGPVSGRAVRDGALYDVVGHVLTGPQRSPAAATYLAAHPASRRGLGAWTPVIAFERAESA
ncbi:hypothetical protein [Nocardioides jishulii]|uniref:Uncharacterized protein n=1 Tax=Nocardioides jishulii TaxID=2575440 RepID=A0A4U2YMK3_9ACTN|nr:hypothetical protein [Nocardioides jishulii]QCX27689.1 hypothetical protein FCL41_09250 [Nocardioides jishulii]TKI62496.1 hypothetical protein FC770_08915 [Nocardioides jishulii]